MPYGQIITLLFILLVMYYAGMITMDIIAAKRLKASEEAQTEEAEIDITGLAGNFEPVEVRRDISRPASKPQKDITPKYREPIMTNGYPVDKFIARTNKAIESGIFDDLDNLVYKCESAA